MITCLQFQPWKARTGFPRESWLAKLTKLGSSGFDWLPPASVGQVERAIRYGSWHQPQALTWIYTCPCMPTLMHKYAYIQACHIYTQREMGKKWGKVENSYCITLSLSHFLLEKSSYPQSKHHPQMQSMITLVWLQVGGWPGVKDKLMKGREQILSPVALATQ